MMRHRRTGMRGKVALGILALAAAVWMTPERASAQTPAKVEKPEPVTIVTADGVQLVAEYYKGKNGKDTVPIVILHSSDGNRNQYGEMAAALAAKGHAVLVPDLRGFGESLKSTENVSLKPETVTKTLVEAMVRYDVDAMKKFYLDKHNAGEVNINKLTLIGVEMGANVAAAYAVLDWSWPVLATGKQGQDVMGLVLISPEKAFRTLRLTDFLSAAGPRATIPVCLIVGGMDAKTADDAERFHNALERLRQGENKWLQYGAFRTKLQGAKLVNEPSLKENVNTYVCKFVEEQVAAQPIAWVKRDGPFK